MERNARKKLFSLALKFLVSAIFLYLVFDRADVLDVFSHLASIQPLYFIASVMLYVIATFISAERWRVLLNEPYGLGRLFSLYMIGSFFNNLLPGMIGGDAVKAYYLYSDTKKGGSSLGSVFMDRYTGFIALMVIGLVAGLIGFQELKEVNMHLVMPALFVIFILTSVFIFGFRIGRRFSMVSDFYEYFHYYIRKKKIMLYTFFLSIIVQLIGVVMVYLISRGIGLSPRMLTLLVFVPVITTAMTVPVSISGFGVREGAFVILFGLIGISPEAAASVSFLWFLSYATASLIGLVEFLRYRKKRNH